ncbi:hypothetical protein G6F57_018900 [Rhizopus arrhizus]|nr:hypothetical protein G6F57_018900 [Rhizopus arrhizus]
MTSCAPFCASFTRWRISGRSSQAAMISAPRCKSGMVAQGLGVRHDGLAHGLLAVSGAAGGGGPQHRQFARGVFAVGDPRRRERARLRQFGAQQRHALVFAQRQIVQRLAVVLRAGAREQFCQRALMYVGALPQVDGGQVEAEDFHGLLQPG